MLVEMECEGGKRSVEGEGKKGWRADGKCEGVPHSTIESWRITRHF